MPPPGSTAVGAFGELVGPQSMNILVVLILNGPDIATNGREGTVTLDGLLRLLEMNTLWH